MTLPRPGLVYRGLAAAALAIFIFANVHLIYVATSTQPRCVVHVKAGDPAPPAGSFSAAGSSC
jgi:hypothetical protein